MREWQSLSHVRWYCRYHVVIVPKYRKKVIFGSLRKGIGKILPELCDQEGIELLEGHAMGDHVHLCLSIPPKFSVVNTVVRRRHRSPAASVDRPHGERGARDRACARRPLRAIRGARVVRGGAAQVLPPLPAGSDGLRAPPRARVR